jgi:hypothetical protein
MSLTPEKTAEMAMKSASKASAISRASVVLPTPGGPQRIMLCSCPDWKAIASGFPGTEQMRLPDHLGQRPRSQALGKGCVRLILGRPPTRLPGNDLIWLTRRHREIAHGPAHGLPVSFAHHLSNLSRRSF